MKKELKQILFVCVFLIIGCVLGYFTALNQMNQLSDPEYIALWTSQNMSVPEPLGFTRSIFSFGLLFAGIPTGLMFYSGIVKKWLTPIAPKIIIGFVTFPIYTLVGVIVQSLLSSIKEFLCLDTTHIINKNQGLWKSSVF